MTWKAEPAMAKSRGGMLAACVLRDEDFAHLAGLIHSHTGIVLNESKRQLVASRLVRRLRRLGLDDFAAYRRLLSGPDGAGELREAINALTTNLTRFFREPHHFDHLENEALPRLMRGRALTRRLRLWSAGSSSGEEAYSMAMVLSRALPEGPAWNARILGTDIDTEMVARGRAGLYDAAQADTVPEAFRERCTRRTESGQIAIREPVKALTVFKALNLLGDWPMTGRFDVIFCRNVVIYFDHPTQERLFRRFYDILADDGYLYVGHSESLHAVAPQFRLEGRTVYRKKGIV